MGPRFVTDKPGAEPKGQGTQPGLIPGSSEAPSSPLGGDPEALFVALHGSFTRNPWQEAEQGPFADYLLRDRSQALSLSFDVGGGAGLGVAGLHRSSDLWSVYDAGPEPIGSSPPGEPIAWFHVLARTAMNEPLPIRALIVCCDDSVARLGTLGLDAVQMLLPLSHIDPSARTELYPSVDGTGWWLNSDPGARVSVRISLDSGSHPSAPRRAPAILDRLASLDQDVVRFDPNSLGSAHHNAPDFVFSDHLWPGPPHYRAAFDASLAEWNPDTVGWLASLLADVAATEQVRTPILVTVTRET